MKLKIKTNDLQGMVAKSVRGASMNKMMPLTLLMGIVLEDNVLTLTTSDGNNRLEVLKDKVEGDAFNVTVQVDLFSKLVAKTTSDTITLTLKENNLEFKGNGKYVIELPTDEEGDLIDYPGIPYGEFADCAEIDVKKTSIKAVINSNKAAVADTLEIPALTGYYFGDSVITTDTFKVCSTAIDVLGTPALLTSEMVELLQVIDAENIVAKISEDEILFDGGDVVVYGYTMEEIEEYPVENIEQYLETEFSSSAVFPKQALIDALDRLNLFVTSYDNKGVYLTFDKKGLDMRTKKSESGETINYSSCKDFKAFTCEANIELLRTQLAAQPADSVTVHYGHEMAIKITSGNITQVIALLQDERAEGNDGEE